MTKEERCKDFLEKLDLLCKETGVFIETFGDNFYNPKLRVDDQVGRNSVEDEIYFELNYEENKYVARKDDPYGGEVL